MIVVIRSARKWAHKLIGTFHGFCEICRDLRDQDIHELGSEQVVRIGLLPLFQGDFSGNCYYSRCRGCATEVFEDPSLKSLMDRNTALEHYRPRVELEQRVRKGDVGAAQRKELLRLPFVSLRHKFRLWKIIGDEDIVTLLWPYICFPIGVALITFGFSGVVSGKMSPEASFAGCLVSGLLLLGLWYWVATSDRRYFRIVIDPRLVVSLADLRPTTDELREVVRWMKTVDEEYAGLISLRRIQEGLRPKVPGN